MRWITVGPPDEMGQKAQDALKALIRAAVDLNTR
jgi:hypothetical protein